MLSSLGEHEETVALKAQAMIADVDTSGSGEIGFADFCQAMKNMTEGGTNSGSSGLGSIVAASVEIPLGAPAWVTASCVRASCTQV